MQRSSLKHTHLLGRHLVLKWADEAEQNLDVESGCRVQRGEEMPERKRKLNISEAAEEADAELEVVSEFTNDSGTKSLTLLVS